MKCTRRSFLVGSSFAAIFAGSPSLAGLRLHGTSGASVFNNGRSQGQSTTPNLSGDFPFLNLLKRGSSWLGRDSFNSNSPVNPLWLDTDGYPLASALSGTNGVFVLVTLPPQASFTGNIQVMWDVTGAGPSDVVSLQVANMATTPVSGSLSSTGNGTNFTYVFTPLYSPGNSFNLSILSLGGTAHLQNFRVVFAGTNATLLAQGKFFNPQFLSVLQQAKFGVWRFMDWLSVNGGNVTTWATRKSLGYICWSDPEWRASLMGGVTTNSGNDYSLTSLGSYAWPGYSSGAPIDKQTMHIRFNADATLVQNNQASGNPGGGTLTISGVPGTATFGWTSHPLANGDIVAVGTGFDGGNPLQNTDKGTNFYVVNSAANTFQIALTAGGTAITSTSVGGGHVSVTKMPTLNLNGSGKLPIRAAGAIPAVGSTQVPAATISAGAIQLYGTMVFDTDLQTWMLHGASNALFSTGLDNQVPIEVCFQLCKELGAHPHWSTPEYTLDPPTDYATSLATYNQSNNPGWMVPHFEPGNEVWNTVTQITNVATAKSFAHWGAAATNQVNDWYAMVLSIMGQGVASIYGLGNLGTTYEMMCGVQTDGGLSLTTGLYDARLTAPLYVSSGPTRSGYTRSSAVGWTSAVLPATYVSPAMRGAIGELQNAWGYYVSNVGNPTAQLANLNAFVDTLASNATGTATFSSGSPTIGWTTGNVMSASLGSLVVQFNGGTLPSNIPANTNLFVSNIVAGVSFQVALTSGGSVINANANGSSTVKYAPYSFTNDYFAFRYQGWKTWAAGLGVNKMFAYEGGYSPDLVTNTNADWSAQVTAATKASSCVLTVTNTNSNDGINVTGVGSNQAGNPAEIGMILPLFFATGMTQLNCLSSDQNGGVTFANGSASISWASNILIANQCVQFRPSGNLPSNITANTTYFVISTGLSSSAFQISATRGGTAITMTGGGSGVGIDTGWRVTAVGVGGANNVTIDVDSTAFGTYTANSGFVFFLGSNAMVKAFRIATLLSATDLQTLTTANYNNFAAQGGLFPSQYQFAGSGSIWFVIQPDVWGTQSQAFAAIAAYNH